MLLESLHGFGIETTFEFFHICGMMPVLIEMLNSLAMYSRAIGPRFLRWSVEIPSGPMALEFLLLLMAA
jgi:hypothetical protein